MSSDESPRPEPREHHLKVTKTARYWTIGDPDRADEVWFVLHGYKQLAKRFLRRFEGIDDGRRVVVAPEGLSRFYVDQHSGRHGASSVVGATWMTREDREAEIGDYVGYLDRLAETVLANLRADSVRVTVLGFSQGVATAARWVTQGSVAPARLVLWGDFAPPDLDHDRAARALTDVELFMVRGTEDSALSERLGAQEAERLSQAGIEYRTVTYPGGHDIDPDTLRKLAG